MAARILVADDDEGYRFPISSLLEDCGFKVIQASSAAEVKELGPNTNLWIVDARLPTGQMEGIIAVEELVRSNRPPQRPVIFISVIPQALAAPRLEPLQKAKIKFHWLEKPFELEALLSMVKQLLADRL